LISSYIYIYNARALGLLCLLKM